MVIYYESLYKPKAEGESELDALSRRMAFKLPIVIRYSIGGAIVFGIVHSAFAKNPAWMRRYFLATPLTCALLCYQDIGKYLQIKGILKPREIVEKVVVEVPDQTIVPSVIKKAAENVRVEEKSPTEKIF